MNHVYQLAWNISKRVWVAASEHTSSGKKSSCRGAKKLLLSTLPAVALGASALGASLACAEDVPTTVIPTGGNTKAYISGNGVPVVDINTANAAGLSHNKYDRFDVEAKGLVLNNGNVDQLARQSQLAGQVTANLNLRNEATVILNEVVSGRRSSLVGFTEVLGGRADVIIANPYGISCNGCGFINTDRATLTTGTANVGADGRLAGFNVNRGEILIEGLGVNASNQQVFDLVARNVRINANINVGDTGSLGIAAGSHDFNYNDRSATAVEPTETTLTDYAIDSSALGGMYAGRIRLIATEAGIGVRMLGDAAASADDFTLSSAGKIEVQSAISADRDLDIVTTSDSGTEDLFVNDAALSANRDLSLLASAGDVDLVDGSLYAGNDLSVRGDTLNDVASAENTRYAVQKNTFEATYETGPCSGEDCNYISSANIDGSVWGAGEALDGFAETLTVGSNGATFYSDDNLSLDSIRRLNLGTAAITSYYDVELYSDGTIDISAGEAQGIQSTNGDVLLLANVLRNAGTISADIGYLEADVAFLIDNEGTLNAGDDLELFDSSERGSLRVYNEGSIITGGYLGIDALRIENRASGNILATQDTSLYAFGSSFSLTSFENQGTFIASTMTGQRSNFRLASFNNTGTLQSAGDLSIELTDTLTNDGSILVEEDLFITAGDAALEIVFNESSLIQAEGTLIIAGDNIIANNYGTVIGGQTDISVARWRNAGRLESVLDMILDFRQNTVMQNLDVVRAGRNLTWTMTGDLNNISGAAIIALDTLTLNNNSLRNYGNIYAGKEVDINTAAVLRNDLGANIYSDEDMSLSAINLYNEGEIFATRNIDISTSGLLSNSIGGGTPRTTQILTSQVTRTISNETEQCTLGACTSPSRLWVYEDTISYAETLANDLPVGPQIISGNNITLDIGAGRGRNFLGTISAVNTLALNGEGDFTADGTNSAGSFVNEAFTLNTTSQKRRYYKYKFEGTVGATTVWQYAFADASQFNDALPQMSGTNNFLSYGDNGAWFTVTSNSGSDSSANLAANRAEADLVDAGNSAVVDTFSSTIKAGAITGTLGALNNVGNVSGAVAPTVGGGGSAANITPLNDGMGISYNGVNINLPNNPNGMFVVAENPNANYLVESNPLYGAGFNYVGSDYLIDRYGYDPEERLRRLGDSNYEAYLIRQQLIAQTGGHILAGYQSEADQMKVLMDQALSESLQAGDGSVNGDSANGFSFGTALTSQQVASLSSDIMWMVEAEVDGHKVLTPVVYLSPTTRNEIKTGAVISATHINLDVASLTNTGGTISGSESNVITSQGDITNASGVIRGGDVALTSEEGSIINRTEVQGYGDNVSYNTDIGKTATIESTGTLLLDAEKDIDVIGANVTAAGDAVIDAGGNINVDTIVDKNVTSSGSSKETTYGYSTTNTNTYTEENIGSAITVGGNAQITAEEKLTIRGSDLDVTGEAVMGGKDGFNIVDAVDKRRVTEITETSETFGTSSDSDSGSHSGSESGSHTGGAYATAEANAVAEAMVEGTADLKLGETVRTVTISGSDTSVSSNINVGGKLTATSDGVLTVQGSNVESGGELIIDAADVDVLAGQNKEWSETTTERNSVGIYTEGDAEANAGAQASANAGTSALGANSAASAGANAEASGTATFGAQTETEISTSNRVTNVGSSLKSGGKMTINADNTATFVGADVESGGDLDINANNIINQAAKDTETKTHSKTTETIGVYLDATVGAEANSRANAGAGMSNTAGGGGGAEISGEVGAGLRYNTESESSTEKTVTHQGNSFKSGGNFTRTATDTIVDQATEVDAGGDITQQARVIRDEAIHDVTTKTSESSSHDVRVGVYAGGSAEASAEADGSVVGRNASGTGSDAEAGAGLSAKYDMEQASSSSEDKTAVTSKFKSGGNISSKSDEKTTLVGTQFESAGDVTIEAESLDYQAAEDSSTSSSSSNEVSVDGKIAIYGSAGAKLDAEFEHEGASSESTTAKAGSINAGGNLKVITKDDATFEGTALEAGNKAEIDSGGNVIFEAAENTSSTTDASANVSAGFSATKKNQGAEAAAEGSYTTESTNTAVVGGIKSGAGGTTIKSEGSTLLEGTKLDSTGSTVIEAGGDVILKAAESTTSKSTIGGSVDVMKHDKGPGLYKGGEGEAGGSISGSHSDKVESAVTNINSAGGVVIKADSIINQDATLNSKNDEVKLEGDQIDIEAENTDISVGGKFKHKTEASTDDD